MVFLRQFGNSVIDKIGVLLNVVGIAVTKRTTINIGWADVSNKIRLWTNALKLRRQLGDERRISVVGTLRANDTLIAGYRPSDSVGQVVGFRTRADQRAHREVAGQRIGKHLGIFDDRMVQVTRVRVQRSNLGCQRFDHMRVTVSDRRYVVVAVQVLPALVIEQPDTFATSQVQRLIVEMTVGRAHHTLATRDQFSVTHRLISRKLRPSGRQGIRFGSL